MQSKIVIIDHNDSFTYNLVQLLEEAGAEEVQVCPYFNIKQRCIDQADGILFSPGPGLPEEYPLSLELIHQYKQEKPILGVCMGLQLIVTYFGGTLRNLEIVKHGRQGQILKTNEAAIFSKIDFPTIVGLYHSWAVNEKTMPKELQLTAFLTEGTVMALQHRRYNIQAVQFHPESFMTLKGKQMMTNWLRLVKEQAINGYR